MVGYRLVYRMVIDKVIGLSHFRLMKSLFPIALLAVVLTSCQNKPEPVVESEWSPEQPKLIAYYAEEGEAKYKQREEKYYEDGVLEYSGGYDIYGKRHGDWKYNYPNGNLWSIGTYDHGKKTGPKKVYWPEGQIRYEGSFENDEKSGRWVFYDMEGKVLDERTFPSPAQEAE
jgi:antitoxin component YwqK of YwqJK toxin-antitoxin module